MKISCEIYVNNELQTEGVDYVEPSGPDVFPRFLKALSKDDIVTVNWIDDSFVPNSSERKWRMATWKLPATKESLNPE